MGKRVTALVFGVLAVVGLSTGAAADDAKVAPVSTEVLIPASQTVLGQDIVYPTGTPAQITAVIVTLQPGAETGSHRHDVPLFGYVMEGELLVRYAGGEEKTFRAGDSLLESIVTPHNGYNLSDGITRILVVFAGAQGVANSTALE